MKTKNAGHTPGPWKFEIGRNGTTAMVLIPGQIWIEVGNAGMTGTPEANARLIAAAPDLLNACENALMDWDRHGDISDDELEITAMQIKAAIAKAGVR